MYNQYIEFYGIFFLKLFIGIVTVFVLFFGYRKHRILTKQKQLYFTEEYLAQVKINFEPFAYFELYTFIFNGNSAIKQKAIQEIESRLSRIEPQKILGLEQYFRSHFYYSALETITPSNVKKIQGIFGDYVRAFSFLACHPNGHVREQILKAIGKLKTEKVIPFIALRMCDWVKPIRELARTLLEQRFYSGKTEGILANLTLIQRVTRIEREGGIEFWEKLLQFFAMPENQKSLEKALEISDRGIRRICAKLLDSQQKTAFQKAIQDSDQIVQRIAAKKMIQRPDIYRMEIEKMAFSRSTSVRMLYLEWLVTTKNPELNIYLTHALMDKNRNLRGAARFHLGRINNEYFKSVYAKALETTSIQKKSIGVLGLGEIGAIEFSEKIKQLVNTGFPKLEAAALRFFSMLEPEKHEELFRCKLLKSSGKIAKEAFMGFLRVPGAISYINLNNLFKEGLSPKRALLFSKYLQYWDRILWCLKIANHQDTEAAKLALQQFTIWLNRGYAEAQRPSQEQATEIKLELKGLEGKIPKQQINQILFAV